MSVHCGLRFFFLWLLAALCARPLLSSSRKVEMGTKTFELDPLLQQYSLPHSVTFDPSKAIQLSWKPRVFFYETFLADEDCDHLIALAQGKMENIFVDASKENNMVNKINISSGIFLSREQLFLDFLSLTIVTYTSGGLNFELQASDVAYVWNTDKVVSGIEERISSWTFLPKEFGEGMLIVRSAVNESYEPHYDYYHEESKFAVAGHRIVTVIMYLSNVSEGGETVFPKLKDSKTKDGTLSPCAAATGYAVKPVRGSAILFFNLHPDATPDETSLHGSCAVLDGEKWTATKWIHVRGFNPNNLTIVSDEECTDEDVNCPNWAASGECQKNPVYMLGTPDYYGSCRRSCGAC